MAVKTLVAAEKVGLSAARLRTMYEHVLLARLLDERMWILNRQGKAPFVISCQGHEVAQVAVAMALDPGRDWLVPYYRDLAVTLVMGMTPKDHLLSCLGRADDPNSGSRQMPSHFGCRRLNIVTTGSPVATQILHACGVALAHRMRGEDAVTFTAVGEGGTSEGDFYEGLNFASVHRLPVVFMVQNNGYAISVPWSMQMPTPDAADRASAFSIPAVTLDGNDPIACYAAAVEAVARARRGDGPTLLEVKVHRLTPHSSDDNDRVYRPAEEIEAMKAHDCLNVMRELLEAAEILTSGDIEEMRAVALAEIDRAETEAQAAPMPEPQTALLHVYGEA